MQLAGVPIRDDDVREFVDVDALRAGGFEDVAHKLEHALAHRDAGAGALDR